MSNQLAAALLEAAQSLETISKNAGKYLDSDGEENMLRHYDQVRGYANSRATVARQALAAHEAAKPEPVAWSISYDGNTPYALWHEGDGALLDYEIKRLGGTAQKMALYAAPVAVDSPLSDEQLLEILGDVDADTKRLPPGVKAFARAIEQAHGIKEKTNG